jgi:polyisoprenoid-binding protein YceI
VTRSHMFIVGVGAAAIVLIGVVLWWTSRGCPAEADLSATVQAVSGTESAAGIEEVDGVWTIDSSIGSFSVEDPTSSIVGVRVDEELASVGAITAVGRTPDVAGTLSVDETTLASADFVVDLTTILSDESRRDDNIQDALNTENNPTASFTLTEAIDLGDALLGGNVVAVTIVGDMTINGVTNRVSMPVEA